MANAVAWAIFDVAKVLHKEHKKRLAGKIEKDREVVSDNLYLQPFERGKNSTEKSVLERLLPLVNKILQVREELGFSPTQRGWCYVIEGLGICTKGDFAYVQSRITKARKLGLLPLDITAEDVTRIASVGAVISESLDELIAYKLGEVVDDYSTCTIEEFSGLHLELVVEKLDLVGLLAPVTDYYKIP